LALSICGHQAKAGFQAWFLTILHSATWETFLTHLKNRSKHRDEPNLVFSKVPKVKIKLIAYLGDLSPEEKRSIHP